MKVIDLAEAVAPGRGSNMSVFVREKLHEIMITEDDARRTLEYKDYYVIQPEFSWWRRENGRGGTPLPDGFKYSSDTNESWLTVEELRRQAGLEEEILEPCRVQ